MTFNTTHPELEEGEMFLTNLYILDDKVFNSIGYNTKRKGNIGYTVDGEVSKNSYPIFVQKKEYDEVQMKFKSSCI